MELSYQECQLLVEWLNSLNIDVDAIPDKYRPLLEKLQKVTESPEKPIAP